MRHGGESTAQQVILPFAAGAAVSLQRGCDRIRHLARYVSISRRYHRWDRGTWRCINDGIEEIAELLLCFPQNRLAAAPHSAGWIRWRGAARTA
jgi:hypothetical protein